MIEGQKPPKNKGQSSSSEGSDIDQYDPFFLRSINTSGVPLINFKLEVIQNGDFYFEVEDEEMKLMKKNPYELLKDTEKKQLGKNEEAKMNIYNALPHPDYSSKNHVRKFLRDLPLKWRAKVMAIEEANNLATLPLDELVGNLKVYEMILENDSVVSKTSTKDKVKYLALKAKVTRKQTSDNSTCQDESDEDKKINLMAKNFRKLSRKGVKVHEKFDICKVKTKGGESSRCERGCYNCSNKNHLADKCPTPNNKAFVGVAWSDSEDDDDEPQNDATCLMAIDSQEVQPNLSNSNNDSNIINLQKENEKLLKFSKDFAKTYKKLFQEKLALEREHSKLFSKVNKLELEVKKLKSNEYVIEPCQECVKLT
ncbi:putative reverse transcriptase domain-containing protein [Tanacetum coccineum]